MSKSFPLLLLLAACHQAPTPAAAPAPAEAEPAQAAPVEAPLPRQKATTATDEAQLGTLPEGVGVAVGQAAPDATVSDAEGRPVALADLMAEGPTLLVFYRGGWCPYCNHQMHELTQAWDGFQARGITPVAISVDRADESAKTRASWEIPFPVLSDPDLVAHTAWNVLNHVDDETYQWLTGLGHDLEEASGRDHHTIGVPSMFLVDADGTVRWAHADPAYKVRPTPEQVFAIVDGLAEPLAQTEAR